MQKRMQFERGDVRRPCQRANVVDQDVVDVRAAFTARNRKCFDPSRREARRILFVKGLAVTPVRDNVSMSPADRENAATETARRARSNRTTSAFVNFPAG